MAHLRIVIRAGRSGVPYTPQTPGFVPPMRCKHATQLPSGQSWFYEVKHEGHRVIAVKDGPTADLFSERGELLEYPEAREAVRQLKVRRVVIDCGLITLEQNHQPSTALGVEKSSTTRLYAFDLLHLNGRDLTAEPIERRKERLCTLLLNSALLFSPSLNCEPEMLVTEVQRLSGVGVVAKRKGSIYQPGACTESWITMDRLKSCADRLRRAKRVPDLKTPRFRGGMMPTDASFEG